MPEMQRRKVRKFIEPKKTWRGLRLVLFRQRDLYERA